MAFHGPKLLKFLCFVHKAFHGLVSCYLQTFIFNHLPLFLNYFFFSPNTSCSSMYPRLPTRSSFCWRVIPNPQAYSSSILQGSVHLSLSQEVFLYPQCDRLHEWLQFFTILCIYIFATASSVNYTYSHFNFDVGLGPCLGPQHRSTNDMCQFQVPLNNLLTSP